MNPLSRTAGLAAILSLSALAAFSGSAAGATIMAGSLPSISLADARGAPATRLPREDGQAGYGPSIDLRNPATRFFSRSRPTATRTGTHLRGVPGGDVPLDGWNEPAIVVNPLDPMNIAYASLYELRVSTDGGATWEPPVPAPIPVAYAADGDASLAFDSQGRLFWTYLASPYTTYFFASGADILLAQCDPATGQVLPGYPVDVTAGIGLPATLGNRHDKEWLAADCTPSSPFRDNLYLVWTQFGTGTSGTGNTVLTTSSSDQGMTWSSAFALTGTGGAFKWPSHITVGPAGNVYAAFHRQVLSGGVPDGISGRVQVYRSTDAGATFTQVTRPFTNGESDMTFNRQDLPGAIPQTEFLLQGSVQPWVLADPNTPGRLYVIANDDPDNVIGSGDAADVYFNVSTDYGATWATPQRIDSGPGTTFQVMPTAAIDKQSGAIVVHYYDNRRGAVNGNGNFLLDVFATVSLDGGATWTSDFQINDAPFDPDAGARCRYGCGGFVSDAWVSSGVEAFAATESGGIMGFDGATWSTLFADTTAKWGIWGSDTSNVLTCGDGGQILRWDGNQATTESTGTTEDLFGIDGRSGNDIYAVGASGTVLHYDGIAWSPLSPPTSEDLFDVWVNPTGDAWIVGDHGTVLRHDGTSWTSLPVGTIEKLGGAWGPTDSDVWVTGWVGTLYHWDGAVWDSLPSGLDYLNGIWGSGPSDILALGFGLNIRYDGVSWTRESPSEHWVWKVHGSGPTHVLAVGEDGAIAAYDGSWTLQPNPEQGVAPTRRIGEYNGVAAGGGRSFAVWCGNTSLGGGAPHDQQTIFGSFDSDVTGVSIVDLAAVTSGVDLEPAWPNPGQGPATFAYSLPQAEPVELALVDVRGRRVATLIRGSQPSGRHVVAWDGRDGSGNPVASGVYFLRLEAGAVVRSQKVVFAR